MKLYGLIGPSGKLRGVFEDTWSAWQQAFDFQDEMFRIEYWKRVQPSRRVMKRRGWKVVKGEFVAD